MPTFNPVRKIFKIDVSYVVTLPAHVLHELGGNGSYVVFEQIGEGKFIIRRYNLKKG